MSERRFAVIGGGLTGLSAAFFLAQRGAQARVFEASARWGGQLHTLHAQRQCIELGAEGFVSRSEVVPELCEALGIARDLIDQRTTLTYLWEDGGLTPLADGEAAKRLGFQVKRAHRGRGIRSLRGGMQQLVDALVEALEARGARLSLGFPIVGLEQDGDGVTLCDAGGARERFNGVLLATSSRAAATLLRGVIDEALLAPLEGAPVTSSLSVNLSYTRSDVGHALDGSGFIFPESNRPHGARACAFTSNKFAHRSPDDLALLRVFFRPTAAALSTASEADWAAWAEDAVRAPLAITGAPRTAWVTQWRDCLPVHSAAHKAAVEAVDRALEATPVRLAGAAFHGAGIDAALRSAKAAAAAL